MSMKNTLIEAGRYDQIISILRKIVFTTNDYFAVDYHLYKGESSFLVSGADVRVEAGQLIESIDDHTVDRMKTEDFENLHQYIDSRLNILLRSYALQLSHRKTPDEESMETIRQWSILNHLLVCLSINKDETYRWHIPEGWENLDR